MQQKPHLLPLLVPPGVCTRQNLVTVGDRTCPLYLLGPRFHDSREGTHKPVGRTHLIMVADRAEELQPVLRKVPVPVRLILPTVNLARPRRLKVTTYLHHQRHHTTRVRMGSLQVSRALIHLSWLKPNLIRPAP